MVARPPSVAGRFYSDDPARLRADVAALFPPLEPTPALGVVAPHAALRYSGAIAAETYAQVTIPERVVVLAPNHTGRGAPRSLWSGGPFRLPFGDVAVDHELCGILRQTMDLTPDTLAHSTEHAIEVQLPLLMELRPSARIVPIVLGGMSLAECRELGEGLARGIAQINESVLVVASSDMSHFLPAEQARTLDEMALSRVLALDPQGLYEVVRRRRISMCGFIPTTVMLVASLARGASTAELIRYGNSGETSGDESSVVGYAGVVVRGREASRLIASE